MIYNESELIVGEYYTHYDNNGYNNYDLTLSWLIFYCSIEVNILTNNWEIQIEEHKI